MKNLKVILLGVVMLIGSSVLGQKGAEGVQIFLKPVDQNGNEIKITRGMEITNETYQRTIFAIELPDQKDVVDKVEIGLGATKGSKEIFGMIIPINDPANIPSGIKCEIRDNIVYVEIGHFKNMLNYFAEVKVIYANGSISTAFDIEK